MTWRNVLGMLILVALCGVALWWMQGEEETTERGPSLLVGHFVKDDVSAMVLTGEEGSVRLRRRPEDSELWDVRVGQEWARADAIRIDEILGALLRSDVRTSFPIEDVTPQDLATYGLTEPQVLLELELSGEKRTARFGKRSREGGSVYADRGEGTIVMVVSSTAHDEITTALASGLRDRRVTDLRTYDVQKVEIAKGGVTTLQAEKDVTQIWRVRQPFDGYADPTTFETRVASIVNEQWQQIVEDGAQDLARYGLAKPAAEIALTSKRGVTRTLLLGTGEGPEGGRFLVEAGYHSVYLVSDRFAQAVLSDAAEIRDRSFTRLGFGIQGVTVNVEDTSWVLHKAHTDWEIEKPAREPAEESVVDEFLEQLRQWKVVEFLDGETPADYGISPDGDQLQVETEGGALTTLLIGNETADGNRYAQRKDDGGVVIVLGSPVNRVLRGWLQFKRRSALEIPIDDLDYVGRESGFGDEAEGVTDEAWRRDLDGLDKTWKPGIGQVGEGLDAQAMTDFLRAIRSVRALDWYHSEPETMEDMGFRSQGGTAAAAWLEIGFRSDIPDIFLSIGKKHPERNAYYAHKRGSHFVFLMDPDTAAKLTAPLMK